MINKSTEPVAQDAVLNLQINLDCVQERLSELVLLNRNLDAQVECLKSHYNQTAQTATALNSALQDTRNQHSLTTHHLRESERLMEEERAIWRRLCSFLCGLQAENDTTVNFTWEKRQQQEAQLQEMTAKVEYLEQQLHKVELAAEAAKKRIDFRHSEQSERNSEDEVVGQGKTHPESSPI